MKTSSLLALAAVQAIVLGLIAQQVYISADARHALD